MLGAAGGVVFGVEVEDDFLAAKVAEGEGGFRLVGAADDGGGEVRGEGVEGGFGHGGGGMDWPQRGAKIEEKKGGGKRVG